MDEISLPALWTYGVFFLAPLLSAALFLCALKQRTGSARLPSKWYNLILLNLLAAIAFITAAFFIGETYYRFFYDETSAYNSDFVSQRWFARHYHRNSVGVRDNVDYRVTVPPGMRRVTFLGDSFTAAQGIKDVDHRFANRIRARHPEWDIQVLAIPGMDTGDQIKALEGMLSQHYPMDLVVLVYCLNDLADLMPQWQQTLTQLYAQSAQRPWLVTHSYFANTYYYRLQLQAAEPMPDFYTLALDAYRGPEWETQKMRLAKIRTLVENQGGHLVVVTFPFLHNLHPVYPFAFVHSQLDNFWQAEHVPHLDLLPALKDQPPEKLVVNRHDTHPGELAHALAADAINQFLEQQIKTLPPKNSAP